MLVKISGRVIEVRDDDLLVLESGDMIRAWAYDTHYVYNKDKSDVRIKEVLRSVMDYRYD